MRNVAFSSSTASTALCAASLKTGKRAASARAVLHLSQVRAWRRAGHDVAARIAGVVAGVVDPLLTIKGFSR